MQNNAIYQFIADLIDRLFSSKPGFFGVIQWVSTIVGAISTLIIYLQSTGVSLPSWVVSMGKTDVIVGSIVALIIAQLPKQQE